MPRELTEKQKKFCEYYIETNSVKLSGEKAGYAKSTIKGSLYSYLKRPWIIEYIKILKINRIYNVDELVNDLKIAMDVAIKANKPDQIIKIIELKLRLSGIEDLIKLNTQNTAEIAENKPKKDLFEEIEKYQNVFDKLRRNIQENNS